MGAAYYVDQDQRVEGDEGGGAEGVDAAPGGDAGGEGGDPEDRESCHGLQHRHRDPDRQPRERIGEEGEEGPVGARRFGPGDLGVGGIAGRRQRRVDVGVEPVADAEPGVVDVAVDVVGEQDGRHREARHQDDDRPPDGA